MIIAPKLEAIKTTVDYGRILPGHDKYLQEAISTREAYDTELLGILEIFNIKTEFEAITGSILKVPKFLKRKQHEIRQRVTEATRALRHKYMKEFEKGVPPKEKHLKASAWYAATYMNTDRKPLFLSFAWVIHLGN